MNKEEYNKQLNIEFLGISALREVVQIATHGDMRATYKEVIKLGKELYPELYNSDKSILVKENESDTVREYRQRASAESTLKDTIILPTDLIEEEIDKLHSYIRISQQKGNNSETDKLKLKLNQLEKASEELSETKNTENDLLLRDIYDVERKDPLPMVHGKKFRDFSISSNKTLRIRLLHPDKPEHISGADIIYEKHNIKKLTMRVAAIQYKLWDKKQLYQEPRMSSQLNKLHELFCLKNMCKCSEGDTYRFPCCSAFLRPTDKIQKGSQKLLSSGLHVPLCKISELWETGTRGGTKLTYKGIKKASLTGEMFEALFNSGKVGSREFSSYDIDNFYKENNIFEHDERIIIHVREQ